SLPPRATPGLRPDCCGSSRRTRPRTCPFPLPDAAADLIPSRNHLQSHGNNPLAPRRRRTHAWAMSRAFIKEDDSNVSAEELPERPQSPHPNHVTPGGLVALQSSLAELQEQRRQLMEHPDAILAQEHLKPIERDIRYFQERIERANVIDPAGQPHDRVSFGAIVSTVDD